MFKKIRFRLKLESRFYANHLLLGAFLFLLSCSSSIAIAGMPVGQDVYIYNVGVENFSTLWQVDTQSTCSIKVYMDIDGKNEVQGYTCISNTNASELSQARGVMQVDIKNLPSETNMYYIQTISTEKASGATYVWPEPGNLLSVKTEPFILNVPPNNGLLEIMIYDSNGIDPNNPLQNLITDGFVTIVDAGGNYPVSSDRSGWPQEQFGNYFSVLIDFSKLRSGNHYDDWTILHADQSIKIMCFGGRVPGIGLGERVIQTIYPGELIQLGINQSWYPCVSELNISDFDGCIFYSGNHIILKHICRGDFDSDKDVDGSDLRVFASEFGRTNCTNELPCQSDYDKDDDVDGSDLAVFAADFGRTDCQ